MPPESWASSDAVRRSMLGNRRRDTAPELALRSALHRLGLRFRVDARPVRRSRAAPTSSSEATVSRSSSTAASGTAARPISGRRRRMPPTGRRRLPATALATQRPARCSRRPAGSSSGSGSTSPSTPPRGASRRPWLWFAQHPAGGPHRATRRARRIMVCPGLVPCRYSTRIVNSPSGRVPGRATLEVGTPRPAALDRYVQGTLGPPAVRGGDGLPGPVKA